MSVGILLNHSALGDKVVFPNTNPVLKAQPSGTYGIETTRYWCRSQGRNSNSPILSMHMDLTKYKTLSVTSQVIQAWNHTYTGYWLLSEANWKSGTWNTPRAYLAGGTSQSKCAFRYEQTTGGTSKNITETKTYDISSLSGIYYLDCGAVTASDNADSRTATVYIQEIVLLKK